MKINPICKDINNSIIDSNKNIYEMLSKKGKSIFLQTNGIIGQSTESKQKNINATIGIALEDDGSPMRLKSVEKQINLHPSEYLPYTSSYGMIELRTKWQELIFEKNPTLKNKKISLPIVTTGLTHGLSIISSLFLEKNEEIIIPNLFWGNYKLIFTGLQNGKIKPFNTFKNNKLDLDSLKEALDGPTNKKILLLNFPNNPTGYSPTNEEVRKICNIILKYARNGTNIIVICDDAYFGLNYETDCFKESLFSILSDIHKNVLAIKIDGATKEDYVWGLRIGFITFGAKNLNQKALESLESKAAGAIRGTISCGSHLSQSVLLNAINNPNYKKEKKEKFDILKKRYKLVKKILNSPKYKKVFDPLPYNSGYFMCIRTNNINTEKLRKLLLNGFDTGIIIIGDLIRIAYSSVPLLKIKKLFSNIYDACEILEGENNDK